MKNGLLAAALFLLSISSLSAQDIKTITINSKELNQTREILIYTPMAYDASEYSYHNVIYVFDAQDRSLFDYASSVAHLLKEGHKGFIVVGITATYLEEEMYGRNHDFLPSDTKFPLGPKSGGNAEAFLSYVKNEVVPYVEKNYKSLRHRTAIGHSLSASFLVYSLLQDPELFDNYIAVSPNLSYDDERLVDGLRNFNPETLPSIKYFYLSHANESEYWKGWGPANENADAILRDKLDSEKLKVIIEEYPNEWHRPVFIPSVKSAMINYFDTIEPQQNLELSDERYEVTFRVKVPSEANEVFITGNQESLGNWEPGKIKMTKVSPLEHEITLQVQDPVEVKFTRGNWETEAWIKIEDGQTNFSSFVRPVNKEVYEFEIAEFMN